MTFQRCGQHPTWSIDTGDHNAKGYPRINQRLMFATRYMPSQLSEFNVWFENEQIEYAYVVKSVGDNPKKSPLRADMRWIEVANTQRTVKPKNGLEHIVISALHKEELVGESAAAAVHTLFWEHFVDDEEGLNYFFRHASREKGNYYARQRVRPYVEHVSDRHDHDVYQVIGTIEDALGRRNSLAGRMGKYAASDQNFRQAIEAIGMTNEEVTVQHKQICDLVMARASTADRLIALIVDAFDDHVLRALRLCQRIEGGDQALIAALSPVLNEHDERRIGDTLRKLARDFERKSKARSKKTGKPLEAS